MLGELKEDLGRPLLVAHRGSGTETSEPNTIGAFRHSIAIGMDGFEADLSFTTDGQPIIYHPGTLLPEPTKTTLKRVQAIHPNIPTLDDLCRLLRKNWQIFCFLDIKQDRPEIENAIDIVNSYGVFRKVFFTAPRVKIPFLGLETDVQTLKHALAYDHQIFTHVIDTLPFNLLKSVNCHRADITSFGWLNDSPLSQVLFNRFFKERIRDSIWKIKKFFPGTKIFGGITLTDGHMEELMELTDGSIDGFVTDSPQKAVEYWQKKVPKIKYREMIDPPQKTVKNLTEKAPGDEDV